MTAEHDSSFPQQPETVRVRLIVTALLVVTVAAVVGVVVAGALLGAWSAAISGPRGVPSYPAAETVGGIRQLPIDGLAHGLRDPGEAKRDLARYGVIEGERGIARIPIDEAMQWLIDDAEKGTLRAPDPATTLAGDAGAR